MMSSGRPSTPELQTSQTSGSQDLMMCHIDDSNDSERPLLQYLRPTFSWRRFYQHFFTNLFQPFSTPFVYFLISKAFVRKGMLFPLGFFTKGWSLIARLFYTGTSLSPLICLTNGVLYGIYTSEFESGGVTLFEVVWMPLIATTMHRLMMALKWGSLSAEEYQRMMAAPPAVSDRWDSVVAYVVTAAPAGLRQVEH